MTALEWLTAHGGTWDKSIEQPALAEAAFDRMGVMHDGLDTPHIERLRADEALRRRVDRLFGKGE
jgi:hypothetical protein